MADRRSGEVPLAVMMFVRKSQLEGRCLPALLCCVYKIKPAGLVQWAICSPSLFPVKELVATVHRCGCSLFCHQGPLVTNESQRLTVFCMLPGQVHGQGAGVLRRLGHAQECSQRCNAGPGPCQAAAPGAGHPPPVLGPLPDKVGTPKLEEDGC